ncbi:hypothetical protein GCM10020331_004130 [Ectobacillus funiculus]
MPELMTRPFVPVSDASGEVVKKIGSEVTKFKEGDRVTLLNGLMVLQIKMMVLML